MLAPRAIARPRRRAVYAVLGCILAAALGAAAATRSWIALTVELGLVLALLAVVLYDLRAIRGVLNRLPEKVTTIRERVSEQRRFQAVLATELYDQCKVLGRPFPAGLGPLVLRNLIARGDVLEAFELTRGDDLTTYPLFAVRRLRDNLVRRGYYRHARQIAEFCAGAGGTNLDHKVVADLRGELAVLTGAFRPTVPPQATGEPVPGRVLHLVGKSLPQVQAGYTLRTHYIVTAQRDAGLDPHVATRMGFAVDRGPTEVVDGITHHRLAGPLHDAVPHDEWLGRHVAAVADLVRELRPAILHAASDYTNALTAEAVGRAYGIPVVYESRGFWEETWLSRQEQRYGWNLAELTARYGLPDFYLLRKEIEDRVRRDADRVVTLAGVMADRIADGGVARDRIEVVPNAVDVSAFPVLTRNAGLAAKLGIAPDTVVIGYISSLAEYEGIDTLIAAYRNLSAGVPTALLIVGDGPVREELQAAAAGITGVQFTGQVPHRAVLDYYSLIDVFVVPRRPVEVCHLVTPLKPFEAFATGRTVVLSDVRALASIAEQSGAAALFRAGDVDSLSAVLTELIADPARRRELADAGAAWVRAERTWAANAEIYLRLYREMLGTARGALEPA
ncbi:MAG TPA: glycosyltransferase family 4 protein [Actinoplanes sp.]|nr:glycosyltransferase family 4 protein [Actinoplanes sp.]